MWCTSVWHVIDNIAVIYNDHSILTDVLSGVVSGLLKPAVSDED